MIFSSQMMSCAVHYNAIIISAIPYQISIFEDMGGNDSPGPSCSNPG